MVFYEANLPKGSLKTAPRKFEMYRFSAIPAKNALRIS